MYNVDNYGNRLRRVGHDGRHEFEPPWQRRLVTEEHNGEEYDGEREELPAQYIYETEGHPRGSYRVRGTHMTHYTIPVWARSARSLTLHENQRRIRVFWSMTVKWTGSWVLHLPRPPH